MEEASMEEYRFNDLNLVLKYNPDSETWYKNGKEIGYQEAFACDTRWIMFEDNTELRFVGGILSSSNPDIYYSDSKGKEYKLTPNGKKRKWLSVF